MAYWFVSDTHFGHERIIKYCKRPFNNLQEMEDTIIKNWNSRVAPTDTVIFLGDFGMKKSSEAPEGKGFDYYKDKLNGKIIFIEGNHDHRNGCKTIIQSMVIKYGGDRIFVTHNPDFSNPSFKINFCGHVHNRWTFKRLGKHSVIVNLSVEKWNYQPVNINEIKSALNKFNRSKKAEE